MQAFYQGKIDNFCALYAVLNALQVLFHITPIQARTIFHRTLLTFAGNLRHFEDILEHRTDYADVVDYMLEDVKKNEFPGLKTEKPFGSDACREEVWEILRSCACPPLPRVSVFRFMRMVPLKEKPYVDHWTVGHYMDTAGLHLLDCSIEAGGLYCLPFSLVAEKEKTQTREYVIIPPECVRILYTSSAAHFFI